MNVIDSSKVSRSITLQKPYMFGHWWVKQTILYHWRSRHMYIYVFTRCLCSGHIASLMNWMLICPSDTVCLHDISMHDIVINIYICIHVIRDAICNAMSRLFLSSNENEQINGRSKLAKAGFGLSALRQYHLSQNIFPHGTTQYHTKRACVRALSDLYTHTGPKANSIKTSWYYQKPIATAH